MRRGCGKTIGVGSDTKDFRCGRCFLVHYCGKECQINDWNKGGHKKVCLTLVQTGYLFNKNLPLEQRMSLFENACICCGLKEIKDDRVFNQIETLTPNFYKNILQLLSEDAKLLEKATVGPIRKHNSFFFYWVLLSFFKDTSSLDYDEYTTESTIHVERFLRLLRSDPQVWPMVMRELVSFVKMAHGGHNKAYKQCIDSVMPIANAMAVRPIAEIILSSQVNVDITVDALKEMGSLVMTSSFAKNVDEDTKESITNALLFFVGYLDFWGSKFYKHKLPGGGTSKHHFVTRVGIAKRYMTKVLPHIAETVEDVNDFEDLLE